MNGDTLPDSGTRSVPPLTSSDGAVSVADNDALAGQVFETVTYTGNGGSIDNDRGHRMPRGRRPADRHPGHSITVSSGHCRRQRVVLVS
jgi:hypothetical protein